MRPRVHTASLGRWVDPVDAWTALCTGAEASFWLDSGPSALTGMSYLGVGESLTTEFPDGVMSWLRARDVSAETEGVPAGFTLGWVGWLGYEDYRKAGYKLLPERNGERDPNTGLYASAYALLLIPLSFTLPLLGATGIWSAVFAAVLSLVYAALGVNLNRKKDRKSALYLMFGSLIYLPVVLIIFYLDKV